MSRPASHSFFLLCGLLSLAISLFVLSGCTGSNALRKDPEAVAKVAEPASDSLRAKFSLTLTDKSSKEQNFDAVLFSVPGKRYRMELTGPMGIGVASVLWKEDGWYVVFPTEKLYVQGAGYMVGLLSDDKIPMVHIHQVASIFEGDLLPENYKDLGNGNAEEPSGRKFSYGKEGSHVSWIKRAGHGGVPEMLHFGEFKAFEGVDTPTHVVFELDGKKYLEIRVKTVKRGKPFSMGTWRLNIPKSFKRID